MSLTNGALSLTSNSEGAVTTTIVEATSGTGPYTHQLYMSTTTGFTPAAGNLLAGKTALVNIVSGLTPNTAYFFKDVVTDAVNATDISSQLAVTTPATAAPNANQFKMSNIVGQTDGRFNYNTIAVILDASETGTGYAGSAVKQYTQTAGAIHVKLCDANSNDVLGFINYNSKNPTFTAGMPCEISMTGNWIYLMPTVTGTLPNKAQLDITCPGGVKPSVGSSGAEIVGDFIDVPTLGVPCRVKLGAQSHTKA